MNSRTSRPRSPTSASTVTGASVPRVIIESSVDLPTPEPAKMPMRWPRPHGIERVERAHAERQLRRRSCAGSAGAAPAWSTDDVRDVVQRRARRRSGGRGRRARGRAARADRDRRRAVGAVGAVAGADAAQLAERHAHEPVVAHRDDLGDRPGRGRSSTATALPIGSCRPSTSRLSPTTRATRPVHAAAAPRRARRRASVERRRRSRRAPRGRVRARRRCGRRCGSRRRRRRSRRARAPGRARARATRPGARSAGSPSAARSSGCRRATTWPCSGAKCERPRERVAAAAARRASSSWPTSTSAISNATATTWSSMSTRAVASRVVQRVGGVAELRHEAGEPRREVFGARRASAMPVGVARRRSRRRSRRACPSRIARFDRAPGSTTSVRARRAPTPVPRSAGGAITVDVRAARAPRVRSSDDELIAASRHVDLAGLFERADDAHDRRPAPPRRS